MYSIWENNIQPMTFPPLSKNISTDVLIIGSGITKNTTAKITVQHGLIYHKLTKTVDPEQAGQHLQANEHALDQYRSLCRSIDCDFGAADSCVYSLDNRKKL